LRMVEKFPFTMPLLRSMRCRVAGPTPARRASWF
jgi:hypothetical protein